jgi:hypothetical protein
MTQHSLHALHLGQAISSSSTWRGRLFGKHHLFVHVVDIVNHLVLVFVLTVVRTQGGFILSSSGQTDRFLLLLFSLLWRSFLVDHHLLFLPNATHTILSSLGRGRRSNWTGMLILMIVWDSHRGRHDSCGCGGDGTASSSSTCGLRFVRCDFASNSRGGGHGGGGMGGGFLVSGGEDRETPSNQSGMGCMCVCMLTDSHAHTLNTTTDYLAGKVSQRRRWPDTSQNRCSFLHS